MPTDAVAASCTGIVKIYFSATGEVHALQGIDALFPSGSVTAIVGPSGSGKSSLLRILAGMDTATAGVVVVGDTEITAVPPRRLHKLRRRLIGFVFQRPAHNVVADLTVQQHLDLAARLRGVEDRHHVDGLLETLDLDHRRNHPPHHLSGGEQQRVAFAQAVIGEPAVVVADEPTAELDSVSAGRVMDSVGKLARRGVCFVIATHDPLVVDAADATLYLRHGALESETKDRRSLAVIDAAGRVQLPQDTLKLFPGRRAVLRVEDGEIRITPP